QPAQASQLGEVHGSPPTAASSPPTDHGPDLGCVTTSHIDGRAGWWKSPCPDLARGRGGKPPGLLYNGIFAPASMGAHLRSPHRQDSALHLCTAACARRSARFCLPFCLPYPC